MGLNFSNPEDEDDENKNLLFYSNQIPSRPWPGYTIDEMLHWCGDYSILENNHSYIQWLFPIPGSRGMNSSAQPLYEHEAKAIREHDSTRARVLMAYKMMLDFYGMQLVNHLSGEVRRNQENWQERYTHLNKSTHNYRRITRIITSLGELGYERFQVPWITFLMEESIVRGELPNLNGGCMRLWIEAIKNPIERETMKSNYFELFKKPELCKTDNNDKSLDKSGEDTDGKQDCNNSDQKSEEEVEGTDSEVDGAGKPDRKFDTHDTSKPSEKSTIKEIEKEEEHTLEETMEESNTDDGQIFNHLSVEQIAKSTDDYKDGKQEEKIVGSISRPDDNQRTDPFQSVPNTYSKPLHKPDDASCSGQSVDFITFDFQTTFDSTNVTKQSDGDLCHVFSKTAISIEKHNPLLMNNSDDAEKISKLEEMTFQNNSNVLIGPDPICSNCEHNLACSQRVGCGTQSPKEPSKDNASQLSASLGYTEKI